MGQVPGEVHRHSGGQLGVVCQPLQPRHRREQRGLDGQAQASVWGREGHRPVGGGPAGEAAGEAGPDHGPHVHLHYWRAVQGSEGGRSLLLRECAGWGQGNAQQCLYSG